MLALNRGRPEQMGLREHARGLPRVPRGGGRPPHQASSWPRRATAATCWSGLAIAVANIDEVIHIIRSSKDPAEARERLVGADWPAGDMMPLIELIADPRTVVVDGDRVRLTDEQARAILALTLSRLTGLGRDEIFSEAQRAWPRPSRGYLEILGSRERMHGHRPRGAGRGPRRLRRAAPHRDRRGRRRPRGRGPDRPRGHGRHRHPRRLRQAHAAVGLPDPAPRRQGPLGHGDQGRGRRRRASSPPRPTRRCCSSPPAARSTS